MENPNFKAISVTRVSPAIGAEIEAVDLKGPLSSEVQQELRIALRQYQVIFFRNQEIGSDDLVRLGNCFGRLAQHVSKNARSKATDNPYVRKYHFDEKSEQISERELHSDQSCARVPPAISILYNHTVPPHGGGDTVFANQYFAYDALSSRMKAYLDGLTAVHDGTMAFGVDAPVSSHPVVIRHPETGRKALFVNAAFTTRINELPTKEGRAVLDFLFEHCRRLEWSCRFRWSAHAIAVWDNRCTLHKALFDFWPNVRSGYRAYVAGEAAPSA